MKENEPIFDVAFSFAGEDREYVETVASILKDMGIRVFYDKYESVTLWGKDLYVYLDEIYRKRAKYTVMFLSQHYADKLWTNHERKSAQARMFSEHHEYILPARFDETEIPGILPTMGYVDLRKISPSEFAQMVKKKIGPIQRCEFFPEIPDLLYKNLGVSKQEDIEKVKSLSEQFYETLKLMTSFERQVLLSAVCNGCPAGSPDNIHLNIEYLGRLVSLTREEIISLFSRLDCLHIITRVYETDHEEDEDIVKKSKEIIEIKYKPCTVKYDGNFTYIVIAIFDCLFENLCPECVEKAIEYIDLSVLGSLTGFSEKQK